MPFTRFAFPVLRPRRLDLVALAVALVVLHAVSLGAGLDATGTLGLVAGRVPEEPWRLASWVLVQQNWLAVCANTVGLAVGLTMAARCGGGWVAWVGLAGAVLLPGLWAWQVLEPDEVLVGASPALYAALGMGVAAWFKLRHELTYARRADVLSGLATLGLVGLVLLSRQLNETPASWIHAIGLAWGAILVLAVPRTWDD